MTRQLVLAVTMAAVVVLAGCSTGISELPDLWSDGDRGTIAFYVSDERNDIDDFRSLEVMITRVGFQQGGENGTWVERDVDNRTVDLTALKGDNATLVGTSLVPAGNYTSVFAYVSDVNGTLTSGADQRVKLPSGKLQLHTPFTVAANQTVEFVFDITVVKAGQSGKYILKPVVGESGTDVPIDDVDADPDERDGADDDDRSSLNVSVVGSATPGENVTIRVTDNGTAAENVSVWLEDERLGVTDAAGEFTLQIPGDAEELELTVRSGESEGELALEFESDDGEA